MRPLNSLDGLARRLPVSVKGVAFEGDEVLLLRNERGELELPGGKIDVGESPEDCVAREFEEELGRAVEVGPLLDAWLHSMGSTDVLILVYGCRLRGTASAEATPSVPLATHRKASVHDLEGLPLPAGYHRAIRAWNEGRNKVVAWRSNDKSRKDLPADAVSKVDKRKSFPDFHVDWNAAGGVELLLIGLQENGLVTFSNMASTEQLLALAESLGTVFPHRDSDSRGVTRIAPASEASSTSGYAGFSKDGLAYHTDRSGVPEPPDLTLMLCKSPAPIGGDSVLVDGYEIRAVLASRFPEALRELSRPASVVFGGGDAFHAGAIFEDGPGGIHIRFRYDNLAYFSPPLIPLMPSFLSLLDERAFSFRLGAGQGYIVDNRRWLHGRTAFSGPREMHRLLVRRR